jgi:hypothetical protein
VSIDLGRRLIAAGIVPPDEIEAALFISVVKGVPFARALLDRGSLSERALEEELGKRGGLALRNVVGVADLMARLPRAMCRRLGAVPTRLDPYTGTIDVAAADPLDPHVAAEFGFHLAAPIRVIRAPIAAVEEAIRRVELEEPGPSQGRARRMTPAFPHGAPSSTPPPPLEDVPIPLVRRVGVPLVEQESEAPTRRRAGLESGTSDAPSVSFPSTPPPPPSPDEDADGIVETVRSSWRPSDGPKGASDGHRPSMPPAAQGWPGVEATPAPAPAPPQPSPRPPAPSQPHDDGPPPLPFADPGAVLLALREAPSRDEVVRQALRGLRLLARRVALFVVKRDGFHGWACNVEFADPDAVREIAIPMDQPSVFATAMATSGYLGPIPATSAHTSLLSAMGQASRDVAVATVRAGGRPAMLLIADDLGDTMTATKRMDELARAAGDALTRLLKG